MKCCRYTVKGGKGAKRGFLLQVYMVLSLTVSVYSNNEVISHSLGLAQLVGVAVMHHVVAVKGKKRD